jgi:hypothetical protein
MFFFLGKGKEGDREEGGKRKKVVRGRKRTKGEEGQREERGSLRCSGKSILPAWFYMSIISFSVLSFQILAYLVLKILRPSWFLSEEASMYDFPFPFPPLLSSSLLPPPSSLFSLPSSLFPHSPYPHLPLPP